MIIITPPSLPYSFAWCHTPNPAGHISKRIVRLLDPTVLVIQARLALLSMIKSLCGTSYGLTWHLRPAERVPGLRPQNELECELSRIPWEQPTPCLPPYFPLPFTFITLLLTATATPEVNAIIYYKAIIIIFGILMQHILMLIQKILQLYPHISSMSCFLYLCRRFFLLIWESDVFRLFFSPDKLSSSVEDVGGQRGRRRGRGEEMCQIFFSL